MTTASSSPRSPQRSAPPRECEIYDGRHRLGTVREIAAGGPAVATLTDGKKLGRFPDLAAARSAIMAASRAEAVQRT